MNGDVLQKEYSHIELISCVGRGGKTCECDLGELSIDKGMELNCRPPQFEPDFNITTYGPVCWESGTCLCGECHCYKGRNGPYCECGDCPL